MKATVVFEDMKVSVDGNAKRLESMPSYDPNWRVIQWKDDRGWIEVISGDRIWLSDISVVTPFIDEYNATVIEKPVIDFTAGD